MDMDRLHRMSREDRHRIEECLAAEVASDSGVAFAYLYGSFVDPQPFRDIDVGVYLMEVRSGRFTTRALEITQRLSEAVRIPVDVRILNRAPVSFLYHVLRGQLIFCRDGALLAEVMERTVSRYLDIAPLLRRGTQEAFAA
jgi:predicted nucleotidyltransferase